MSQYLRAPGETRIPAGERRLGIEQGKRSVWQSLLGDSSNSTRLIPVRYWGLLVAGIAWVWVLVLLFPDRSFLGSDDSAIASILQGSYGSAPEPRAVFINVALGAIVAGLSSLWPEIGWYGVTVWSLLGVGLGALFVFCRRISGGWPLYLGYLVAAIAVVPLVLRVSFTSGSIILGGIAVTGLLAACVERSRHYWKLGVLASLILSLSLALRANGALAALIVGLPVLVFCLWRWRRRALIILGTWAAIAVVLLLIDNLAYSTPEWADFRSWTRARSVLLDSRLANLPEVKEVTGWSDNDWVVFNQHRYFDEDVFGPEPVARAADIAVRAPVKVDMVKVATRSHFWIITSIVLWAAGRGLMAHQRRRLPMAVFFAVAWTWLATFGIQWFRFRLRVYDGMIAAGLFIAISLLLMSLMSRRPPAGSSLTIGCMVTLIVFTGTAHALDRSIRPELKPFNVGTQGFVDEFADLSDSFVFLGEARALHGRRDPLSANDTWGQVRVLTPGWYAFSPPWLARQQALNVEEAPISLLNEDVLYVSAPHNQDPPTYMSTYLLEHHGIEVTPCPFRMDGLDRPVWRFKDIQVGCASGTEVSLLAREVRRNEALKGS